MTENKHRPKRYYTAVCSVASVVYRVALSCQKQKKKLPSSQTTSNLLDMLQREQKQLSSQQKRDPQQERSTALEKENLQLRRELEETKRKLSGKEEELAEYQRLNRELQDLLISGLQNPGKCNEMCIAGICHNVFLLPVVRRPQNRHGSPFEHEESLENAAETDTLLQPARLSCQDRPAACPSKENRVSMPNNIWNLEDELT